MSEQHISPERTIFFAGETVSFTLSGIPADLPGRAVLRTNIGRAAIRRKELIDHTENGRMPRSGDWHDIAMNPTEKAGVYTLTLPLTEPGVFEGKCCFLPEGNHPALWPLSGNVRIKVVPAENAGGNTIYCAFVRQWGKIKHLPCAPALPELKSYDDAGFTVIPPSGTFRELTANLDHIFSTLNCRILQLLPIHPVPVSYGRMGRYGSPFAATDYFAIDPALAEFDESSTPMEQFAELIDAVHRRRGRIFMDIPVNHTGWASKLQNEHPDYFVRDEKRKFESPGAWGIVWADLCRLDYRKSKVHELMAKVFLFWCRRGVDGFRCDAGYMLPAGAWDYIVAKVRREYPDTVFLLEGLGGPLAIQEKLLSESGLDWGYSELFQNYSRDEITHYYPYMNELGNRAGTLVNFAETHDNDRLAAKGKIFAKSRFLVTALLAQHGAFGFANGAEFYASEKIDVHGCGALNFGNPDNLCKLIAKLNTLLNCHPAFTPGVDVKFIQRGGGNFIAALRSGPDIPELLILINLDCSRYTTAVFQHCGHDGGRDLLSGGQISFESSADRQSLILAPGEGRCISFDSFDLPEAIVQHLPDSVSFHHQASVMARRTAVSFLPLEKAAEADGGMLRQDPVRFVETLTGISPAPLTRFRYPEDTRRQLMIPPGDMLLIENAVPFHADLIDNGVTISHGKSIPDISGKRDFILLPLPRNDYAFDRKLELKISSFGSAETGHTASTLLLLPEGKVRKIRLSGKWSDAGTHTAFGSNALGSYSMFSTNWGRITSKYDALLAANINREFPVDRHIMFSCCRAWLVIDEYSGELTGGTLEEYSCHPDNRATLHFALPDGRGGKNQLELDFRMDPLEDQIFLRFTRKADPAANPAPARLILRPDLEDRINHTLTRACDGAEHLFRHSITPSGTGFEFHPAGRRLTINVSCGEFCTAPEWRYMVDLPDERYYGLPDKTDLFSPGYFTIPLASGESVILSARASTVSAPQPPAPEWEKLETSGIFDALPNTLSPHALALPSLSRFIVRRDDLHSVIAGYPWFLDWGRDTLIALRGVMKFPEFQEQSAQILRRFAAFEKSGTIPNMICGSNDSNRDTSDAPLYLITAVRDYIRETGDQAFLDSDCGGRTLRQVLASIIDNCKKGTPNGIVMDPASKLLFSPAHFSWMDTNHPAGTPREGYPIEIQALWYAALEFCGDQECARQVSGSIEKLFFQNEKVSDCLHCRAGISAFDAVPDDHTRCNMLTAVTFGAIHDPDKCKRIVNEAAVLLIPGAIRTLDDRQTAFKLPIYSSDGTLLNDPAHPYCGRYCGPENSSRKLAYHNGTAWCWPFPAFCEALYLVGGEKSRNRALSYLLSCGIHFESGIPGELPEVLDGDHPHRPGGCPAQAWSVSEFFRVLKILENK